MLFSPRLRAASMIQRMASVWRRLGRTSIGTWSRGPEFEAAFARPDVVRAAIDRTHVRHDAKLGGATEIAFFPPVTGG